MTWPTIKGAVVPVTGPVEAVEGKEPELIKQALGEDSCFDLVRVSSDACGYVDDEGFSKELPLNLRASFIYSKLYRKTLLIVGPMIVFGNPDGEGYSRSIPESALHALQDMREDL